MDKVITITKDLELHPKFLNNNIQSHIKDILDKQVICSQKYGYVLKILDIINVTSLTISSITKFPVFRVTFTADALIPVEGQIIEGEIGAVFSQGVFIFKGPIKILLPLTNMKDFIFDKDEKSFTRGEYVMKAGDKVQVKLTVIKYEKKSFSCICTLNI